MYVRVVIVQQREEKEREIWKELAPRMPRTFKPFFSKRLPTRFPFHLLSSDTHTHTLSPHLFLCKPYVRQSKKRSRLCSTLPLPLSLSFIISRPFRLFLLQVTVLSLRGRFQTTVRDARWRRDEPLHWAHCSRAERRRRRKFLLSLFVCLFGGRYPAPVVASVLF